MTPFAVNKTTSGNPRTVPHQCSYGHLQEERMREALRSTGELDVRYSAELDCIYKLDAVALIKSSPLLPAVGIQFTMRSSSEKQQRAVQVVRKTKIVNRFLYLRSRAPITQDALVLLVATMSVSQGIVAAVLATDANGRYFITSVQSFPLRETTTNASRERKTKWSTYAASH